METTNECCGCGNETKVIQYSTQDSTGKITQDFLCKRCASELGFETIDEYEIRNRKWWRNHLEMKLGCEVSDEKFELYYNNKTKN